MLFNSLLFAVFFPTVVILYFLIPYRFRWFLLLMASYYFYMCWRAEYIILIILSTAIDYFAALAIEKTDSKTKRKCFLSLSLFTNLGLLFLFKYYNFFSGSLSLLFNHINIFYQTPSFKLLLPVGISFYTFQTLSYTIDVYLGKQKAERHLGIFALYVSFFPQLVAGPIERSTNLLPQFYKKNDFSYERVRSGLIQMAWGFFKKIVIADRLALYVNEIYNHPTVYSGAPVILATYFFAFQIFCDFSAYSDIAIGSARVMGYDLMRNFDRPYFSKSISEFWKRWHISLSTWFRDYLYIPLGGNRTSKWKWYRNLFLTFFVSGIWHGANWTFVLWGALHGFYLIFAIWTQEIRAKISSFTGLSRYSTLHNIYKTVVTFHLVLFSWVFFRANNITDAFILLKNMLAINWHKLGINVELGKEELILTLLFIAIMEIIHLIQNRIRVSEWVFNRHTGLRWAFYCGLSIIILVFGEFGQKEFIYFQF